MALSTTAAHAQPAPAPGRTAIDALVEELRLLRRTLERQSATASRSQLLMARLSLQDQRLARARQVVERLEMELAGTEREQSQIQMAVRELGRSVERTTDDARRQELEQESRVTKARLADAGAALARTEARLAQARQSLDAETARYDELESWLVEMDRQLVQGGS